MHRYLLACLLIGCWTGSEPAPVQNSTPTAPLAAKPTPMNVKLELVEGTPSSLPDGTTVHIKGVMYAHLKDSKNLSSCTLMLARDGATAEVSLSRLHGDPSVQPKPGTGLGWTFTLEMADPYQQPSHAIVVATRP